MDVYVDGVNSDGEIGVITIGGWSSVTDAQNPGWITVNETQSAGWRSIDQNA